MRNIVVPRQAPALRPPERDLVPHWRRNTAPELLLRRRTLPFPVDVPVAAEHQRPLDVLAGGVLRQVGRARREVGVTRRRGGAGTGGGGVQLGAVVGEEVKARGVDVPEEGDAGRGMVPVGWRQKPRR